MTWKETVASEKMTVDDGKEPLRRSQMMGEGSSKGKQIFRDMCLNLRIVTSIINDLLSADFLCYHCS